MTIQKMRELKEKLESSIHDEITSYNNQTGLEVASVSVERRTVANADGGRMEFPARYTVEVRVEL